MFEQWEIIGVLETRVCLKPMISPWALEMLMLYQHYKNGVLWQGGGISDQPASYLQAMEVIESNLRN